MCARKWQRKLFWKLFYQCLYFKVKSILLLLPKINSRCSGINLRRKNKLVIRKKYRCSELPSTKIKKQVAAIKDKEGTNLFFLNVVIVAGFHCISKQLSVERRLFIFNRKKFTYPLNKVTIIGHSQCLGPEVSARIKAGQVGQDARAPYSLRII